MRKAKKAKFKNKQPQDGTLIGYTGKRAVYLQDDGKHVFICGTTGSGKTVLLANFIKRAIEKDIPLLLIDGKGDIGNGSILDIATKLNNSENNNKNSNNKTKKKIYTINLSDPINSDKYNPFQNASATIIKDMIINMTDWSEEHYKLNAERYIQRITKLLETGNIKPSFNKIIKCIPTEKFTELSLHLLKKELITKNQHSENIDLAKTSGQVAQSSTARFSTIAESEVGQIFDDNGIDILTALKENAIIIFILNPLIYPEVSPAFGRLVLIDAKKAVSNLFNNQIKRTFFIMDEINVYASTVLTDLVNKSRSANITCMLATQSLSDLDQASGESFKEQIIENTNNYILLRQNSGINAEHWANILGTKETMEVSYQLEQRGLDTSTTGFGSARKVREYLYHPDEIKTLRTGQGIYLSRDTNHHSRINISMPNELKTNQNESQNEKEKINL